MNSEDDLNDKERKEKLGFRRAAIVIAVEVFGAMVIFYFAVKYYYLGS